MFKFSSKKYPSISVPDDEKDTNSTWTPDIPSKSKLGNGGQFIFPSSPATPDKKSSHQMALETGPPSIHMIRASARARNYLKAKRNIASKCLQMPQEPVNPRHTEF